MKKCDYCGRESPDEATHCHECGTAFVTPSVAKEPAEPADRFWLGWVGFGLRLAATVLVLGLVYLLSFGPVDRYSSTTISQTTNTTGLTANGQTAVVTYVRRVSYPRWVIAVYRPALMLKGSGLYGRYLQWWERRP